MQREAENSIDEGDPGPIWDQITEWLDQRVAAAVSETFVWTDERSRWLSEEVAQLFSDGESALPAIDVGDTQGVMDPVEHIAGLDAGRLGAGEKIYIGNGGASQHYIVFALTDPAAGARLLTEHRAGLELMRATSPEPTISSLASENSHIPRDRPPLPTRAEPRRSCRFLRSRRTAPLPVRRSAPLPSR